MMIEPQQDGQNSQLGMDINADGQHSETLRAAEQFGLQRIHRAICPARQQAVVICWSRPCNSMAHAVVNRARLCRHSVAPRSAAGGYSAGQ
ncbi:MAG: hypothetical protein U1E47_09675 [Rivihabitans pingtungensis]